MESVSGIVCLATPFLYTSRKVGVVFPEILQLGWYSLPPVGGVALYQFAGFSLLPSASIGIALAVVGYVGASLAMKNAQLVWRELQPPRISRRRTLVVEYPCDEAYAGVMRAQLPSVVARRGMRFVQSIQNAALRSRPILVLMMTVFAVSVLVIVMEWAGASVPYSRGVLLGVAAVMFVPLALAILVAALVLVVFLWTFFYVGEQIALALPFIKVAIASKPNGPSTPLSGEMTDEFMEHSAAYQDEAAIKGISGWIRRRARHEGSPQHLPNRHVQ